MDEKAKMYLGIAILLVVIVAPIFAYYYGHGNKNPITPTQTSVTTTTSIPTSTSATESYSTTLVTVTNIKTVTNTVTTTKVNSVITNIQISVPSAMETATVQENVYMYGLSISPTTIVTSGTATFETNRVVILGDTLVLETISGAPVSAVFVCCGTQESVPSTAIDIPYSLPMKIQLVSPVYTNGTIVASFIAPWPQPFGGAMNGTVTIGSEFTLVGTFNYSLTMNGIVKSVAATLTFVGEPQAVLTSMPVTTTSTQTIVTTTVTEVTSVTTTVSTISP